MTVIGIDFQRKLAIIWFSADRDCGVILGKYILCIRNHNFRNLNNETVSVSGSTLQPACRTRTQEGTIESLQATNFDNAAPSTSDDRDSFVEDILSPS